MASKKCNRGVKGVIQGDLNGDGIGDLVLVLEKKSDNEELHRRLLILLGRKEGGYYLSLSTDKLLDCGKCGGRGGDPLDSNKDSTQNSSYQA